MQSFFPRDVLDEIWDLVGSVPEGFPTYSLRACTSLIFVEPACGKARHSCYYFAKV